MTATATVTIPGQRRSLEVGTQAIVERVQAGDTEAFAELYRMYEGPVFRFIWGKVKDRHLAEDLTADTFVRAFRAIGRFEWSGREYGALLMSIARNLTYDHFKSGRYRIEFLAGDTAAGPERSIPAPEQPENAACSYLTNVELLTAVKQLSPEQYDCVVFRFLHGMSVAETAAAMGKAEGAVKALQFRATRALARLLPEGFER